MGVENRDPLTQLRAEKADIISPLPEDHSSIKVLCPF